MPGVIIDGKQIDVHGLKITNWLDNPTLRLKVREDYRARYTKWIRSIVWHTTKGLWPCTVKAGFGPDTKVEERIAKLWATDGRNAGAHLSVDWDGSIGCHADLLTEATYHAGEVNEVSIGGEIYQGQETLPNGNKQGILYDKQLDIVVQLTDWLTARFGIQRQIPLPGKQDVIQRCATGGKDVIGVYGHRHVTTNRGPGDPGDQVFQKLEAAGYETFDFVALRDKDAWLHRQMNDLDFDREHADGVPGPSTVAALKLAGHRDGLWVQRA